ncbi:glutamate--tRNA ligase [Coemansia sp. S146]|nr:glutamate--tRNA ligase [Coemansia sp. S146]
MAGVVAGSVVSSGGLLAAGFADHVWQLCLAQGVAVGIGAGVSTRAAVVAVGRRRVSDDGGGSTRRLVLVGAGIGGCVLALGVSRLITVGTTGSALRWLALVIFSGQILAATLLYFLPTTSEHPPVISNDIDPLKIDKQAAPSLQHKTVCILRLISHCTHSLTAIFPLVFIPSYAEEETRLNSAILVATLCVGVASGAALSALMGRWAFKESVARLGLSLCVWCLWLPLRFGDSWALLCVFCGVYGLFLGLVTCLSAGAVELLLAAAAATMVGVPVAGWITASNATTFAVDPVAALAAACSLMSAVAAVAADAVVSLAGGLAEFANGASADAYTVEWQEGSTLKEGETVTAILTSSSGDEVVGEAAAIDALLSGTDGAVSQWVDFALKRLAGSGGYKDLELALGELDHHLTMRAFISGYALTAADVAAWGALRASAIFQRNLKTKRATLGSHLVRWYEHVDSLPFARRLIDALSHAHKQVNRGLKDQGSFDLGLTGIEHGKVVTRFPPEPSGYLHIGHAKAALLNEFVAKSNGGRLLIRFDDTNPTKERVEFEDSILEDLAILGIQGDALSHTSDHFQVIYEYALELIRRGLAYVDDSPSEEMREGRMHGLESKCRRLSVEENLARFQQMKEATEFGQKCCLRAKMSIDNNNKAMRDPAIYRCLPTPHHRTGSVWKIYPLYDFACPIVDSIEGVTHALRSSEYRDRNPQYQWFFSALDLRPVQIMDFSRMNFAYTLLSKRKLQWFVDQGRVPGWDDPRFPTVRGIKRRGMTIEALRQYVLMQGASQRDMLLDWDKIWAMNKKVIDPKAPRHTALVKHGLVPTTIDGPSEAYLRSVLKHKKAAELGTKNTVFSSQIFIEQDDAAELAVGEELTLMDWGNAIVEKIERIEGQEPVTGLQLRLNLAGDVKSTKKKITWLGQHPTVHPVEALLLDYDYLITKKKVDADEDVRDYLTPVTKFEEAAIVDANVGELPAGTVIQLERKGYFIIDQVAATSQVGAVELIKIPDGKAASMASKHTGEVSVKSAGSAGNPWDKKKGKAAKPVSALGLGSQSESSSMYEVKPVYGDIDLEDTKSVTSMYSTGKIY